MTLLNHIGIFLLITLCFLLFEAFDKKTPLTGIDRITIPILTAIGVQVIFEAFYWIFKIFF